MTRSRGLRAVGNHFDRRSFLLAATVGPMALAVGERATGATGAAEPLARELPVIGRAAWGALKPRDGLVPHTPRRLTLHHSGVRLDSDADSPGRLRIHQRWHMNEKGHPDIDYHFVVDRRGHVFQGRNPRFRGDTQTDYDPTGHFLVCCEGDYQGTSGRAQVPTRAMLRSVALLFAAAAQRWDIDPRTLQGHRDYTTMTSCPGGQLERLVRNGSLQESVTELMAAGPVRWRRLARPEARATVARIESGA